MINEFTVRMRRMFGGDSPMNVWRKQFTEVPNTLRDAFLEVRHESKLDADFMIGPDWPVPIGAVLNIRKPQRISVQ